MSLVRTFVSYSSEDSDAVLSWLARAAPYGIRPWLDTEDLQAWAGRSISELLDEALADPDLRSLTIFVSPRSLESGWVRQEVEVMKRRCTAGSRVLPFLLDPAALDHDDADLHALLGLEDALCLRGDDPLVIERWGASVLGAAGVLQAPEVALHLGARQAKWLPQGIPDACRDLPVLDVRLHFPIGHKDVCPSADEWSAIEHGLSWLERTLRATRISVFGFAPTGVFVLAGRQWDRGGGVEVQAWNWQSKEWWSVSALHAPLPRSDELEVRFESDPPPPATFGGVLTVAVLHKTEQIELWRQWRETRRPNALGVVLRWDPLEIETAARARHIARAVVGALLHLRGSYPNAQVVEWVSGLPVGLNLLVAHLLRGTRGLAFLDEVRGTPLDYRQAARFTS
jgi:hypothetical protein